MPPAQRFPVWLRALLCLVFLPLLSGQGLFGGNPVDQSHVFPLAIGPVPGVEAGGIERVVRPGEIVFRTPLLYERLAILDEPLRIVEGGQTYELPAGQLLPYMPRPGRVDTIWYPPGGELFCLDSSSGAGRLRFPILLFGTTTKRQRDWARYRLACLADLDRDGRFDMLALSAVFTNSTVAPTYNVVLDRPVAYNVGPLRPVPGENEVRVRYLRGNAFNSARFLIEFVSNGRPQDHTGIWIKAGADGSVVDARTGIRTAALPQTVVFPRAEVTVLAIDRQSGAARLQIVPSQRGESYQLLRPARTEIITIYVPH